MENRLHFYFQVYITYLKINAVQYKNCLGQKENKQKKEFRMKSCLGQEETTLGLETHFDQCFSTVFLF